MKYILLICIVMLNLGCTNSSTSFNRIRGFDMSKNDEVLVYSFVDSADNSFIKRYDFKTKKDTVLARAKKDLFYVNPRYSPGDKSFIFIEFDKKDLKTSSLCFSDSEEFSKQYLIKQKGIITDAIFSEEGDKIFFLMANNYESYSPIGIRDSHNFDIYSYDIQENKISKISNIDSYKLAQLSLFDKDNLLIFEYAGASGGMFLFNLDSKEMKRIVPANNSRGDAALYDTPIYSKKFNLFAFIAPYEIYAMDFDDKVAERVFDNRGYGHISHISFYNTEKKILFVKHNVSYFFSIDLENHNTEQLPIN